MENRESQSRDTRSWAPPRSGVEVERRDPWELTMHGMFAGVLAGLALGVAAIIASTALRGDPWLPFDFAAALVVGPEALAPTFPAGAALALGTVIHLLLSVMFGVSFVSALALTFQLSARPRLLLVYGAGFGFLVWEVNFLAVLPIIAPDLRGRVDLTIQLWNGILSYCLVYGPALALYVALVRPGTRDRWWLADRVDHDEMPEKH
jgi:hypothetical protein